MGAAIARVAAARSANVGDRGFSHVVTAPVCWRCTHTLVPDRLVHPGKQVYRPDPFRDEIEGKTTWAFPPEVKTIAWKCPYCGCLEVTGTKVIPHVGAA